MLESWNGEIGSRMFSTIEEKCNHEIRVQQQKKLNFLTVLGKFFFSFPAEK